MPFVWVTNVGVGAAIDAADRNETRTNIEALYTALGANWPGNVRFPVCVGAGYDVAAPCPVVWPIAIGDDIYQTPGAHPVSELQEARDKLDWIDDNKCPVDNAGHDNPVNGAANPTTQGAANPTTRAAANPSEDVVTQAAANPITQAVAEVSENAATQALENLATELVDDPGCTTDCPAEDGVDDADYTGDDYNENLNEDTSVNPVHDSLDDPFYCTIDLVSNYSDNEATDYIVVEHSDYETEHVPYYTPDLAFDDLIVDLLVFGTAYGADREEDNTHHCTSEHGAVRTHVDAPDHT